MARFWSGKIVRTPPPAPSLTIYPSPFGVVMLLLATFAFVAVGVWLVSSGSGQDTAWGVAGIVFFGGLVLPGAVLVTIRTMSRQPILVVDLRGITNRSYLLPGFIPWAEVSRIGVQDGGDAKYLAVGVSPANRAALMSRANPAARWAMRVNVALGFEMVNIPVLLLPIGADDLCADMSAIHEFWRGDEQCADEHQRY